MDLKRLSQKPSAAITGLSVSVGLLADFREAASTIEEAIPLVKGFLPIIAIGGTVSFSLWLLQIVYKWLCPKMPKNKFGECLSKIQLCGYIVENIMDSTRIWHNSDEAEFRQLSMKLAELNIPHPNTLPDNPYDLMIWFHYLVVLEPSAESCDLKKARNLHVPTKDDIKELQNSRS